MPRRLLNLPTALSLLLCVAACVLWVRSRAGHYDAFTASRTASWTVYSGERTICVQKLYVIEGYKKSVIGVTPVCDQWTLGSGWGNAVHPNVAQRFMSSPRRGFGHRGLMSMRVGFRWWDTHARFAAAPHWAVAAITAVAPLASVAAGYRRRRRTRVGHCLRCGYDLRATPDRCPECGTATEFKAEQHA